ncbi:MAG: integration host factor, actinobacterial type [Limnochordia bacterium]|nr:integration host factor, actinobacterial type [Bacillota bacterium]NLL09275.1 integration host factor [Bacillota bacterium]HBG09895.1 integration host factor [Bacillota bacterium]
MSLPVLTPEEKLKALKKAQEMRSKRAELRLKLKKGSITLREVLEKTDDEVVARMRVTYLLQSLPQVGKVTSEKLMREIGINENRRVQGLGKRQKEQLLQRLG